MNNQIGFYCPTISNTKKDNIIINVLNNISSKHNTILFNSQYGIMDTEPRKFAVLHCNQSKYFYGNLFCFDIDSVYIAKSFPGPNKKFFVTSEIFWQNKAYPAKMWYELTMKDIDIVTYDKSIFDIYEICFKPPVFNMANGFSLEEFNNVIDSLC